DVTSWSEPARPLPAARPRPQPRLRPKAAPRSRRRSRHGVAGGLVWIGVIGVLLAGVVALNVAVLRLNVRLDKTTSERAKLHAENAALASELSSAAASPRIQTQAQQRGLVPAQPDGTTYVDLLRPVR
ncbi:MAG: hypothetical protein WBB74_12775, partial [Gaiellaceae bacterium]